MAEISARNRFETSIHGHSSDRTEAIDEPEGLWVGRVDPENNFAEIKTDDRKFSLFIPELFDELRDANAAGPAVLNSRLCQ